MLSRDAATAVTRAEGGLDGAGALEGTIEGAGVEPEGVASATFSWAAGGGLAEHAIGARARRSAEERPARSRVRRGRKSMGASVLYPRHGRQARPRRRAGNVTSRR